MLTKQTKPTHVFLITIFMMSFLVPAHINIGPFTLGFTRLFILIMFFPAVFRYLSNVSKNWCTADLFILLFAIWTALSLLANNGFSRINFIGLSFLETVGAYIFARAYLDTLPNQRYFWKTFGVAMLCILPFGLYELLTDRPILIEFVSPFLDEFRDATVGYEQRLGLNRVTGNFEHPILFGVFWAYGFSFVGFVYQKLFWKVFFSGASLMMVFISLSSGAFLVVIFQCALMFWGLATKESWKLLLVLFVVMFAFVEIASERSAIVALATRLAFSGSTAYTRVNIWIYGTQAVWANPVFGIGLNDWPRPFWLTSSVDNHWLLIAMRSGLPALFFLFCAFSIIIWSLIRRDDFSDQAAQYRRSFLITFVALFVALGTVAIWSGTQSFFFSFLGMGASLAALPAMKKEETQETGEESGEKIVRYTRGALKKRKQRYGPVMARGKREQREDAKPTYARKTSPGT